jgi:hypothetical protein
MKYLHITLKAQGGAATGAVRTHVAMLESDMQSSILFLFSEPSVPNSFSFFDWAKKQQRVRLFFWQGLTKIFGRSWAKNAYSNILQVHHHPAVHEADAIVLHQVDRFVSVAEFVTAVNKPILWLCPDFAPITGGEPYPETLRFPWSSAFYSQVHWVFTTQVVQGYVKGLSPYPFQSYVVPYPLDVKWVSNHAMGRNHVLFCAADLRNPRKGFLLLYELWKSRPDYPLLTAVGAHHESFDKLPNLQFVGLKTSMELLKLYQGARLFITPASQEMFGQTTAESLAVGTPVISGRTWGALELIREEEDGLIVDLDDEKLRRFNLEVAIDALLGRTFNYEDIADRNFLKFRTDVVRRYTEIVSSVMMRD